MKKIKYTAGLLCTAALLALPLGCGKKQDSDDPAEPVNLTVWVYYNGDQLESFNQLVAEFNDTTGREKGVLLLCQIFFLPMRTLPTPLIRWVNLLILAAILQMKNVLLM